jgi:hypothetical protein
MVGKPDTPGKNLSFEMTHDDLDVIHHRTPDSLGPRELSNPCGQLAIFTAVSLGRSVIPRLDICILVPDQGVTSQSKIVSGCKLLNDIRISEGEVSWIGLCRVPFHPIRRPRSFRYPLEPA